MFSVRIISVDHYQSMPTPGLDVTYSQFRGTQVKQVPVIRIFGTTPTGQKTCLHIHGVFPYFYVPYDGSDESARVMYQIAASLDKAINISLGHSNSNAHHVFKIVQVSGKPFYGYHSKEHQFLKVFLYNPLLLKRAVDLLQNGVICNKVFQPYEAHIPFVLQFFIDYNLYGMNFIDLKSVLYRIDVSSEENVNCDSVNLVKESLCELEADAVATDILNRLCVSGELAVNPGLAAIWEDEKQRRGEGNEISQQESQPRPCRNPTVSELLLKEKLKENLRMQGRNSGQRSVLQEIPYPAETQEGSNMLNASTLDTHHTPSLELPIRSQHEESVVNEELVLSLTSTNDENALSSQDKSMVNMLMELMEMNAERRTNQEVLKAVIDENVEDDSILGSQMLVENEEDETLQGATLGGEECQCQNSASQVNEELQSEHESLENQGSHHSTEENCDKYADNETTKTSESGVQWDDTFWNAITDEDIPQLDGAGDILSDEEAICSSLKTKLNFEYSAENNSADNKIADPVKDSNWCNEIYDLSIIQTDGMNSESDYETIFEPVENAKSSLNNILRGDPSLTSSVGSFSDELTGTVDKSCDNSVAVPMKELENSCKKNIDSDICIGRIDDGTVIKQNVWKDISESDIYKTGCKEDSNEYSTNTVPLSITEIEGCENVCDGIVCSEPLCYDNLLETSQFDDNLTPSSFIEYQKVEPVVTQSTEIVSRHRGMKHTTVTNRMSRKGKLKIKFSFANTKTLSRKFKKIAKLSKSKLIRRAFSFTDDVTEDMVNTYFTQIENLKQHHSNKKSKRGKGLINLSWSKISVLKSQWRKSKCKRSSVLETLDMNMSRKLDNLNISSFDSDIRELLPCGDPAELLQSEQGSPAKNKYKEISPKCEVQKCDIKLERENKENVTESSVSERNCVVTDQQLTCDNINSILKHHEIKSPDLCACQQHTSLDSLTSGQAMSKPSTCSPVTLSDTHISQIEQARYQKKCKTESAEQLKATVKVNLHQMQLSDSHGNFSSGSHISTKCTHRGSVPEKTVEENSKTAVTVDKPNAQRSANKCQSQSNSVTEATTGITGSPSKSQLSKSSGMCLYQMEQTKSCKTCKTGSAEQLKSTVKVSLHKLLLSDSYNNNFSRGSYINTKYTRCDSILEKSIEQDGKAVATVDKLNAQRSANIYQSQSESVTEAAMGITGSPSKSQLSESCDTCFHQMEQTKFHKMRKTENAEQLKETVKASLRNVLRSDFHSDSFSSGRHISTKCTHCDNVPDKTIKQYDKAVVTIDKLNAQRSANVCQSQVKPVTEETTDITDSPSKSQLIESSDMCTYQMEQTESHKTCKTESTEQFLKVILHRLQPSHSYNFSSTKFTHCDNIPEKTNEHCNKAVMVVNKLNVPNSANVHQFRSKSLPDRTTGLSNCFVKLKKIDYKEENCRSKLKSENPDTAVVLQGNTVSQKLGTNMKETRTVSRFNRKFKSIGKDNEPVCSEVVKHETLVESPLTQIEPSIDNSVIPLRERKLIALYKRFSGRTCKIPGSPIQKNMLDTNFCHMKDVNALQVTNKQTCFQVRNMCESRRHTLRMSNCHNILCNYNFKESVRTRVLEKENKRVNEEGNQICRSRQSIKHKNTVPNIVCIDGTYDSSSSDSCDLSSDSQQNLSSRLTQTPKRHRQVQGSSKQGTPRHRYEPLKIEIKKSPTNKCTSNEQKNSQIVERLHTEFRVVMGKDKRKATNKRSAVGNELDTSTIDKTNGSKKVRVEERKRPVHVQVDMDTSAGKKVKVCRKTSSEENAECSPQETSASISSNVININTGGMNALHQRELRICLQRLSFKNGKPVVEENKCLTRAAMSRLNNSVASADSTAQKRKTSTEIVKNVAEEESSNFSKSGTSSADIQHLLVVNDGKMSETTLESTEDTSNKKSFSRARKRLHFPRYDEATPTSQNTKDSRKSKKLYKKDVSILVLLDSDSSTESLVKTEKISKKSKLSVHDESLLSTCILNIDSKTDRKDHKSQVAESTVNNENTGKTKKLYIPDYDAQPSTSRGVKNVFGLSIPEPLYTSKSLDKLSQSTNPSLPESSDILTLSYTNLSDTEFNANRIHPDCESDKSIISFYNINTTQNIIAIEQNQDINCEKILKLQGITKPNTTYTLSRNPPNQYEVCQNLVKYGFPEVINKDPFVSNPADVVKGKEVGGKVLKVMSRSVRDLEEFESDFSVLSKWQEKSIADIFGSSCFEKKIFCSSSVLATDRHVVITPLKQAPTANEAKLWYSTRLATDVIKEELEEIKVSKIVVPSSPGHDGDEDETTVSLTPSTCSSSATKASGQVEVVHSTPHSSSNYRHCDSPMYTPIVLYDKICFKFKPDVQKKQKRRSSLISHVDQDALPLIVEEDDSKTLVSDNSKIITEDDSKTVTEDDSRTVIKDDSNTVIEDSSKDITEDNSTADCDRVLQEENSVKETNNRDIIKEEQKPIVHTKQLHKACLRRRLLDLSRVSASTSCQIDTVTPDNSGGYKMALENLQAARSVNQHQYLTVMSMELHVATRGDLRPDPEFDAIRGVFYHVINDAPEHHSPPEITGVMIVGESDNHLISLYGDECVLNFADSEQALLHQFIQIVRKWDADIFIGFEIEMLSWGFLIQRAYVLNINMNTELSRIQAHTSKPQKDGEDVPSSATEKDHEIKLVGRIVLNGWRLFRHEVALQSYTFENLMYHILHCRIPLFSFRTLTLWWNHRTNLYRWMTVEHYITRVVGTIKLLVQLDLFERTSELARLFGIQFYEVLSRGSQFRVESMMLRLAKPLNYVPVSPSVKQRAHMRAPGCLPLIMEPESRFYSDPLIVLDFQSLYPSMIIAYNYCFSTCMGRVDHLGQSELYEFGCTQLRVPFVEIIKLEEELNFSPCGVAFVKSSVRKGILPRMLEEILNTRLMVKKSMKKYKDNKILQRILESRQLGLKLIANVTYGYTAANFSGRMPCSEVGDSVVSKGRETLERAISLVKNTPKWGAEVVYGDTDSLFVMVPGKDRKEAFRIGAEIAEAVTNDNPPPVKLKLEKVFQPCILQTKKRYVGYMYESPDEEKPVYLAKGIETVRRDGCPAVAKILEKSLKLLFETKDISLVKNYVTRQFSKILLGRLSVQELTFAREYRGASGYRPGACVPALELAKQWLAADPRSEPRVGERVPYVITAGPPGLPLIRSVRSPQELLADPALKINTEYYITKVIIPPLDRCFSLIGAQVLSWYSDLPRKQHTYLPSAEPVGVRKGTISQYFATVTCVICQEYTHTGVCSNCQKDPQKVAAYLADKLSAWERKYSHVIKLCQSCCGRSSGIDCTSLDCPVLYMRYQARKDLNQASYVKQLQQHYLSF